MAIDHVETSIYENLFQLLGLDTQRKFIVLPEHAITWQLHQDRDCISRLLDGNQKICLLAFDKNPTVMFDFDHTTQYLLNIVADYNGRVKLLSHNLQSFFDSSQEIYFPWFFLQQRQLPNYQTSAKQYRFSFLSNQLRFHRLWFYQEAKTHIIDNDCFAVHFDADKSPEYNFVMSYCEQILGHRRDLTLDLPFFHTHAKDAYAQSLPQDRSKVDWSNAHPAYASIFNITGESTCEDYQVFLTEKTWKSIRSQCLTINLGSQYTNHYLQRLGFDTTQDVDLPLKDKVQWICDKMATLTLSEAQDQLENCRDLIVHNYERFYSQDLINLFRDYLKDRLDI